MSAGPARSPIAYEDLDEADRGQYAQFLSLGFGEAFVFPDEVERSDEASSEERARRRKIRHGVNESALEALVGTSEFRQFDEDGTGAAAKAARRARAACARRLLTRLAAAFPRAPAKPATAAG